MRPPLDSDAICNLHSHQYKSEGNTLLDPIMQPMWNQFAKLVPTKVSPNCLTLFGMLSAIFGISLMMLFCPYGQNDQLPPSILIVAAASIFVYQTMDAIDGKHARATDNCSQLGELLDHGCDAIVSALIMMAVCLSCGVGSCPWYFVLGCMGMAAAFYMAHWMTFITGVMRFSTLDCTEGIVASIALLGITAHLGPEIWENEIPIPGYNRTDKLKFVLVAGCAVCTFVPMLMSLLWNFKLRTVAFTSSFRPLVPLATVLALCCSTLYSAQMPHVFQDNMCVFTLIYTITLAKFTTQLVVSQMSRTCQLNIFDVILLAPIALLVVQFIPLPMEATMEGNKKVSIAAPKIYDWYMLLGMWSCLAYCILSHGIYCVRLVRQIARCLQIPILSQKTFQKEPSPEPYRQQRYQRGW